MKKYGSWTEQVSSKLRTSSDNKEVTIIPPATLTGASNAFTTPSISGTSDVLVSRTSTDTLTNKTLTSPVFSTIVNTGTLTLPTATDTLVARATTDTLSNKTLVLPKIFDTSADHKYNILVSELIADRNITLPLLTGDDTFVFASHIQALTNKSIDADQNTITNIENADIKAAAAIAVNKLAAVTASKALVSDASGFIAASTTSTTQLQYLNAATGTTGTTSSNLVFSTSPTLTTPVISSIVNSGTLTLPTSTDTLVGRDTTDTLTNKTINGSNNTITNVSLTTGVAGILPIANGGTNANSKTEGFDNLAPTTTKGDIIVSNGTDNIRFAVGADGQVLAANSATASGLDWTSPLTNPMDSEGDLIVGGVGGAATKLDSGLANRILQANGAAAPSWVLLTNSNIDAAAAIAYSKLNLSGSIVNADINASAAIATSKLAATTASKALVSNASGFMTASNTSTTQLEYLQSATGTTGTTSTNLVFSTSPTLTSPSVSSGLTLNSYNGTSLIINKDSTETNHDALYMYSASATAGKTAAFYSLRSRGTLASPTVVSDGDLLGFWGAYGYSGAAGTHRQAAYIKMEVDGTPDTAADTTDMPGRILLATSPDGTSAAVDRLKIDNAGVVTIGTTSGTQTHQINGSLALSVGQIGFPATAVPSADANTLDDYEEGTFTPGISSSGGLFSSVTYVTQSGTYTKIGRVVFVKAIITWSAASGGTGTVRITGLPFAAADNEFTFNVAPSNIDFTGTDIVEASIKTLTSSTNSDFVAYIDNGASAAVPIAAVTGGTFNKTIIYSGYYNI